MDVQMNLKLRRSDRSAVLLRKHEDTKSIKREHIKEILIQNFHRHYHKPGNDMQGPEFIQCEKMISDETNQFLKQNSHAVNSKDLAKFESDLAKKLKWERANDKNMDRQWQSVKVFSTNQNKIS